VVLPSGGHGDDSSRYLEHDNPPVLVIVNLENINEGQVARCVLRYLMFERFKPSRVSVVRADNLPALVLYAEDKPAVLQAFQVGLVADSGEVSADFIELVIIARLLEFDGLAFPVLYQSSQDFE
jgi:hypothetical protein